MRVYSTVSLDWVGAWVREMEEKKKKKKKGSEKALTQFKMTAYISMDF